MACDGLWDVLSSNAVVKQVLKFEAVHGQQATKCSEHLAQLAFNLGSTDNISVIVIFFKHDVESN
jgi:serine/threonine protein phosphatase PrpC